MPVALVAVAVDALKAEPLTTSEAQTAPANKKEDFMVTILKKVLKRELARRREDLAWPHHLYFVGGLFSFGGGRETRVRFVRKVVSNERHDVSTSDWTTSPKPTS